MIEYTADSFAFPKDEDFQEPTPKQKAFIRGVIYRRDGGCCIVCGVPLREESGTWWSAHLHHKRGGIHRKDWRPENLEIRCIHCHNAVHNPKAVPPKPTEPRTPESPAQSE